MAGYDVPIVVMVHVNESVDERNAENVARVMVHRALVQSPQGFSVSTGGLVWTGFYEGSEPLRDAAMNGRIQVGYRAPFTSKEGS